MPSIEELELPVEPPKNEENPAERRSEKQDETALRRGVETINSGEEKETFGIVQTVEDIHGPSKKPGYGEVIIAKRKPRG